MDDKIFIKQVQIQSINRHGIHFVNDDGEEDFVSFALSYQSIMSLVVDINPDEFDGMDYDKLMTQIPQLRLVGIYEDSLHKTEVYFLQDATSEIYHTFIVENEAELEQFSTQIEAQGWQIKSNSELV